MSSPQDPLAGLVGLPGVFEAVEAARGAVDALLRDLRAPGLRRRVAEVAVEAARRSAWASASLAAPPGGVGPRPSFVPPFTELTAPAAAVAQGALAVHGALGDLAPVLAVAPRQAVARLHVLAAAPLVRQSGGDPQTLGRPRPDRETAVRLDQLAELLQVPTEAPALVVAGVAHAEVLALDAFPPASGVVARGLARLVMVARGLDARAVTVPEEGYRSLDGPAALDGYRSGTPEGVAAWLRFQASAVAVGAREGRQVAAEVEGSSPHGPQG